MKLAITCYVVLTEFAEFQRNAQNDTFRRRAVLIETRECKIQENLLQSLIQL